MEDRMLIGNSDGVNIVNGQNVGIWRIVWGGCKTGLSESQWAMKDKRKSLSNPDVMRMEL
jgi:hypothetical protein